MTTFTLEVLLPLFFSVSSFFSLYISLFRLLPLLPLLSFFSSFLTSLFSSYSLCPLLLLLIFAPLLSPLSSIFFFPWCPPDVPCYHGDRGHINQFQVRGGGGHLYCFAPRANADDPSSSPYSLYTRYIVLVQTASHRYKHTASYLNCLRIYVLCVLSDNSDYCSQMIIGLLLFYFNILKML